MMAELIDPSSILDMSQIQLEDLIISIRERRERVIKGRSVAHHRARASGVLALRPKLEKLATRLDRVITKLDSDLAKAEKLVREVTAIRLELGDATPEELANELRASGTLSSDIEHTDDGEHNDHDGDAASSAYGTPEEVIDESL